MSVHKSKSGYWTVRNRTKTGEQTQKSFSRKADADRYDREQKLAIERGAWTDPKLGKMSVSEAFEEMMKSKPYLRPKTLADYISIWRTHVQPRWAKTPINAIKTRDVHDWMQAAVADPCKTTSSGRITKAFILLSQILDYTVDMEYLTKNPLRKSNGKLNKIKLAKTSKTKPMIALTPEELQKLAKQSGRYETLILVAGLCGLRWAELVGLQVQDVAPDASHITVSRTLSEVNGKFHANPTKTGKIRVVSVPPSLQEELRLCTIGKLADELLFANTAGKPLSAGNFTNRVLKPAIQASKIPSVTMQEIRHTCASIAISAGANIMVVANLMGHSSPQTTLKHYLHLYKEDREALAQQMDEYVASNIISE